MQRFFIRARLIYHRYLTFVSPPNIGNDIRPKNPVSQSVCTIYTAQKKLLICWLIHAFWNFYVISVFFIGDAVRANRWECLYPGFPVSFLSSAGICCRLGQRDSKAEVKKLTLRCCRLTQKEPHWSYPPQSVGLKLRKCQCCGCSFVERWD